jgi:branched-chain amino acid transport system substrate-binding protein
MPRWGTQAAIGGVLLGLLAAAPAARSADDTIKVGYVDPFSGSFAAGGDQFLKVFQYVVAYVNQHAPPLGRKFELVAFDDKLQPSEALIALKTITDQNMPFVMQCTGSNVGAALLDAVAKHNARNPDSRVLYLNCGALATELTNEKCDFWHFRFTGNVEQRALARVKSLPPDLKKVYLLNQDYLFGQSVQASTRKYLGQLRPDIQVVGDELMPFGKVKDFSPYVTKIKASGAQSIITGNYGPDLNLLIKAAIEAGLDARFDTFLANLVGNATAIGKSGDGRMTAIYEYNENIAVEEKNQAAEAFGQGFRAKNDLTSTTRPS